MTPFEEETGCIVNAQTQADSATGVADAAVRRVRRRLVLRQRDGPAHGRRRLSRRSTWSCFENYANVFDGLKLQPHNSLDGVPYGVPHGRGPNLLIWNTDEVRAPDHVGRHLGERRRLRGHS